MNSPVIIIGLILLITLSAGLGFFFGTVHTQKKVLQAIDTGDFSDRVRAGAEDQLKTIRDRAKEKMRGDFNE